jgi:hypothetical protein
MKFKSDIEVQAGLKDSSGAIGTSGQLLSSTSSGVSWTSLNGFVPYVGATANVNLGTHTLLAAKGVFSSSGSGNTVEIGHPSGSGIALNITKGGNGEGLYINKTSGSGNAVTIIGTLNATTLVKAGGTAAQFLKADGTVDSTTYVPASRTITINGVTQSLAANQTWTVSGGVSGSGAVGQVAYWDGTTSITGESNLFWDATNDRLGIGTTSPLEALEVIKSTAYTTIYTGANGNGASGLACSSDNRTNTWFIGSRKDSIGGASGTDRFNILYNTNSILTATTGGNVGIGTTSPSAKLDVTDTSAGSLVNNITVQNASNTTSTEAGIFFAPTIATGNIRGARITGIQEDGNNAIGLKFYTGLGATISEKMRITSGGNVGIGTASPTQKVQIGDGTGTNSQYLRIFSAQADIYIGQSGGTILSQPANQSGLIVSDNNNFPLALGTVLSQPLILGTSNTERMRITSSGNVGIGTTSPSSLLHIQGSGYFPAKMITLSGAEPTRYSANIGTLIVDGSKIGLALGTRSDNVNYDNSLVVVNGNVGIGTTSPSARLNIYNGQRNTDILVLQNDQINGDFVQGFVGISFQDQNGTNASAIRSFSNLFSQWGSTLTFSTNITSGPGLVERMRINSGGNVGIGTTAPDQRLTVDGNIRAGGVGNGFLLDTTGANFTNGMKVVNSFETAVFSGRGSAGYVIAGDNNLRFGFGVNYSAGESMRITTNGDVCIGTTSANSKFNVTSTFGNTVTFNNTSGFSSASFLGFQASGNGIGGISRNGLANSVLYNTTSDYRLKEDFQDFQGLDLIDNINVYDFKWKGINQREYGVIAHELKEVIPNLVTGEKDGESMQQVDYSKLVPILIQSIKELKAEIEILKNK